MGGAAIGGSVGDAFNGLGNTFSKGQKAVGRPDTSQQDALTQMSQELFNTTRPLRTSLINQYGNILKGSPDLSTAFTGAYAPARAGIEDQYTQARNQILEGSDARGGQLASGLQNASLGRARAVSDLQGNIITNAVGNAQNLALGLGSQGLQGLGAAGQLSNTSQNMGWNQKMQLGQGMGQVIGGGTGKGGGMSGKGGSGGGASAGASQVPHYVLGA